MEKRPSLMLRFLAVAISAALMAVPAAAQSWKEYTYPDLSFSLHFPADPKIEDGTYRTAEGTSVAARIYSAAEDGSAYKMTVADFSRRNLTDHQVLDQAVKTLAQDGEIKLDIPARVSRVFGRQLSMVGKDGSRSSIALFYYQRRLYQIQGTVLPTSADPSSGDAIRFQQSLRFTNAASRLFGLGSLFGATGRL
jgi:hypothetical protein